MRIRNTWACIVFFPSGCTPWCHTGWFSDGHTKRAQNRQRWRSCQFWELHCQVWAARLNHTTSTKTELPSVTFSSSSWTMYWHETGISSTRKYTWFWFSVMVTLLYFFSILLKCYFIVSNTREKWHGESHTNNHHSLSCPRFTNSHPSPYKKGTVTVTTL